MAQRHRPHPGWPLAQLLTELAYGRVLGFAALAAPGLFFPFTVGTEKTKLTPALYPEIKIGQMG